MNTNQPFGFPPFDPSQMDPKLLMELSQLIQQLPPDQLSRMQTLMHNMMAGFDVRKEMEEFERNLPPAFRIRMATLMANHAGANAGQAGHAPEVHAPSSFNKLSVNESNESNASSEVHGSHESHASSGAANVEVLPGIRSQTSASGSEMNLREAKLTVLRAVANGQMTPEEAEKVLFG